MGWNAIGHVVVGGTAQSARFRQSTAQNFGSGVYQDVNLQSTLYNNAPLTKTSTYFTTTAPGYWEIVGQFYLEWANSSTERRAAIRTVLSGNYVDLATQAATCVNGILNVATGPAYIASGTIIALRGVQYSSGTIATVATTSGSDSTPAQSSWLSFRYLGQ